MTTEAEIRLKLDNTDIDRGTRSLAGLAAASGKTESSVTSLGSSATKMFAALGVGLSVNYFKNLITGAVDAADRLNDLKKATSLSIETLAGLKLAAAQTGGTLDGFARTLGIMSKNIGDNAAKFRELGITARDPLEAFKQLSDLFVATEDPLKRAALASEALGRGWQEAAPLLSEGSAAIQAMIDKGQRLSGMTTEFAEQADALNDTWAELATSGQGLLTKALIPMLPAMQSLSSGVAEFAASGDLEKWAHRSAVAVELLAIAMGVKYATAAAVATAETVRLGGAAVVTTAAMTRLNAAMAFFGGPVGVAVTAAAGAMWLLVDAQKESANQAWKQAEGFDATLASLGKLTQAELVKGIMLLDQHIAATKIQIEQQSIYRRGQLVQTEELGKLNLQLTVYTDQQALLARQLDRVQAGWTLAGAAASGAADATAEAVAANDEYIVGMETKLAQMDMDGRMLAVNTALLGLNTDATGEQVVATIAAANAMYDKEQAIKAAGKAADDAADAEKDLAREAERAADRMARESEQAHEAMQRDILETQQAYGRFFADLVENAENASDVLEAVFRSAKRTALEMAGQSIFSGVAGAFGIQTPGLAGSSGLASSLFSGLGGSKFMAGLTKPGAVITDAEFQQLMGGKSTGTGGMNLTDLKNVGMNIGAGIAGSYGGTKLGESLFDKKAESSTGATVGGAIGSVWGPIGSFVGSAIGGMVDAAFGGDGKKRQNAGFFVSPTPGAQGKGQTFETERFESGLNIQGFARRADFDAARGVIDQFRTIDATFVDLVRELGGKIDLTTTTLQGLDEEARAGSQGTFLGLGGNGMLAGDLLGQINFFVDQLADHVTGLDEALLESIRSATTAEEALTALSVAVAKQAASGHTQAQVLAERAGLQDRLNQLTLTSAELLAKQRSALDASNQAIFDQITGLEAMQALAGAASTLASANAGVRAALRSVSDEVRSLADDAESAADDLADAQQRIADLNREAANELRAFGKTIDEFLAGLSPGSHGMSLANLKAQLTATGGLAGAGDKDAQARLLAQAQMVLRSAETASATRADYVRTESFVRSVLLSARGQIVPKSTAVAGQTQMDLAMDELARARTANAAASTAYNNALALTSNLALTQSGALGGLMTALADLGAANADAYTAQLALTAAQTAAGVVVDATAESFVLTGTEASALASVLGLTAGAAQDLIDGLTDPTTALTAFTDAMTALTPQQISAFLGLIDSGTITDFLDSMTTTQITAFMDSMDDVKMAAFMGSINPQTVIDFLAEMSPETVRTFLASFSTTQINNFLAALDPTQITSFFNSANSTMLGQIPGMFAGTNGAVVAGINALFAGTITVPAANAPVYGPVAPPPKPVDPWIDEAPVFITPSVRSAPAYGPTNPNTVSPAIVAELRGIRTAVSALQAPMQATANATADTAGITREVVAGSLSFTTAAA